MLRNVDDRKEEMRDVGMRVWTEKGRERVKKFMFKFSNKKQSLGFPLQKRFKILE